MEGISERKNVFDSSAKSVNQIPKDFSKLIRLGLHREIKQEPHE